MRWILATIVGKVGTDESVSHTLKFRTSPTPDVDQSPEQLLTFGAQVRDAWGNFINAVVPPGLQLNQMFPSQLSYTEVRVAYLESTAPGSKGADGKFHYPKPTYLVPTQYVPWATPVAGRGASGPLPYEVACAMSLVTGVRGPRARGRVYLGPFDKGMMGTDGNFSAQNVDALATGFRDFVHTLNTTTGNRLHVVSRMSNNSLGVNGVRVGLVPDSQRRRRRSRPELYGDVKAT